METAKTYYKQGKAAFIATSFESSIELYSKSIELDKTNAQVYDARAESYKQLGQLQNALRDIKQVVKLLPNSYRGYLKGGKVWKAAKRYENAELTLLEGLTKVSTQDLKVLQEFNSEVEEVRQLRKKAEFSPISQLSTDVFVHIISLASQTDYEYTSDPTPLSKIPRVNMVVSSLLVSKSWYQAISNSPSLWSTLRLDGSLNNKNAEKKILWWTEKALGREGGMMGKGIRNLVISAAGSLSLKKLLGVLRDTGAADLLEELTVSYVDEGGPHKGIASEDYRGVSMERFVLDTCRTSLKSLIWCSDFSIAAYLNLPDPVLFPKLERLWVYGISNLPSTTGPFYVFPFLSPSGGAIGRNVGIPSPLVDLKVVQVDLLEPYYTPITFDAPKLKYIDITSGRRMESNAPVPFQSDSAWFTTLVKQTGVKRFHLGYGNIAQDQSQPKEDPDLTSAWNELESLEIVSSSHLANYLLNLAVKQALTFHHLVHLNLRSANLSPSHLPLFNSLNAPSLIHLSLASTTPQVPAKTLVLPTFSSTLQSLDLTYAIWINDDHIETFPICFPNLIKLNLSGIDTLTGRPIMKYVQFRRPVVVEGEEKKKEKQYSDLEELRMQGCQKVETAAVDWLKAKLKPGGVKFTFLHSNEKATRGRRYDL